MTDTTLDQGGAIQKKEWSASQWLKRLLAVTLCLCLLSVLCVSFTRVIAARVPEQRATLEKLIADRTGLDVRFENVRFAWSLEGTSAVFTRVELNDRAADRVRVVAPELRVQLDTWDLLRHQQFSLGHVTLASPDIEITADADRVPAAGAARAAIGGRAPQPRDEAALLRGYLSWAEAMPAGRIEVEGARVHLKRRGEFVAGQNFTLSEAVISRGSSSFNAYGTMLLSQDVGQSLYVSARLEGLSTGARVSGDLRLIARRVFLARLPLEGLSGRGTFDARLRLQDGRVSSGSWLASARELQLGGDDGSHFDHVTANGRLSRDARDVLLQFTDLQLTQGARLERAPLLEARLVLDRDAARVARTTVHADKLPLLAAEFFGSLLTPRFAQSARSAGWTAESGELHDAVYDSGDPDAARPWRFDARLIDTELRRDSDQSRIGNLQAVLHADARGLKLAFDPSDDSVLRVGQAGESRTLALDGELLLTNGAAVPAVRFTSFEARQGASLVTLDGPWAPEAARDASLDLSLAMIDRGMLEDIWALLAPATALPGMSAEVQRGTIVSGKAVLVPAENGAVDWVRSSGSLALAGIDTASEHTTALTGGRGSLSFARGAAQLTLAGGEVGRLALNKAQLDWPRSGTPRLRLGLQGSLDAPLVRDALRAQGLDRLTGKVALEAEARGEHELRQPELWRVTARISEATVPLGDSMPPARNLAGTIRYSARQLRAFELAGQWLGGPMEIESRRSGSRPVPGFTLHGTADASVVLGLLGRGDAAQRVSGQLAWNATAEPLDDNGWLIDLASNFAGVESRLPEPFDKSRARAMPTSAQLRVAADGLRDFSVDGADLSLHGQVRGGVVMAKFSVHGVGGEFRRAANGAENTQVQIDSLDLKRTPVILAATAALLPVDTGMVISVGEVRDGDNSLGALHAVLARQESTLAFSVDSPAEAVHQLSAHGRCDASGRCEAQFSADTQHLAALLRNVRLPAEWPTASLHASGSISWPIDADLDITRSLSGSFNVETQGVDRDHQLAARGTISDGEILLADVQGTGPAPDQVFRGSGRVGLLARQYDVTVDYERLALAAAAVPTPARARLARAWNAVRGAAPETRRVQWHGTWD